MASKEALRRALLAAQERFLDVVRGLGPDDLALPTENPDWTVHDVLAHLASAERGLLTTIERVRRGEPVPPGYSADEWNARQVSKRRTLPLSDLLAEQAAGRVATVRALEDLPEAELRLVGQHISGEVLSVEALFARIASHQDEHLAQILRACRSRIGP
ncbi:MAG TPA: maleylpyruvate isomerase family mycothiol-dependent enzyme [Chloroflexota bacterium]